MSSVNYSEKKISSRNKLSLVLFSSYIILFPFYFIKSGNPQIADYILVLLFLYIFFENKGKFIFIRGSYKIFQFLGIFVFYVTILNLFWVSLIGDTSMLIFPSYYIFNFLLFLICFNLFTKYGDTFIRHTLNSVVISVLIQVVLTFFYIRTGLYSNRKVNFFNNPNQLGYYALLMGSIFLVCSRRIKVSKFLRFIILVSIAYLSILSVSKAAIIACALLIIIAVIRSFRSTVILIIASLLITFQFSNVKQINKAAERLRNIGRGEYDTMAGRGYDRIWLHPEYLLLGAGEGATYRFDSFLGGELHSVLGAVFFSYGIPGTVLFFMFLWRIFRNSRTNILIFIIPTFIYGLSHQGLRFSMIWIFLAMIVLVSKAYYIKTNYP